jgi:hypothetical protein
MMNRKTLLPRLRALLGAVPLLLATLPVFPASEIILCERRGGRSRPRIEKRSR